VNLYIYIFTTMLVLALTILFDVVKDDKGADGCWPNGLPTLPPFRSDIW
jgi:hypothetical protein